MSLKEKIETKRKQMADLVRKNGVASKEVLKASQELDTLINQAMREGMMKQ
ncbi:aspartyl-phosphate phosphatase Spo0E family protein [Shouchella clausii]|uniref:aspartyl-phosphate phosphatase Spo0E family protein n=1 Tax=Shouchella TaxID=2893057 RepID=UPI0004E683C0|nr:MULTISPECIES: aspartyl-phosphate phosphatase Spo0E family protein [Shouchella]ALA55219.1 hypothetical protein DB29_0P0007 [Shouchella clausii]MBU3266288.1 aspartyl-phosphate phosphatase Spo0E family protein [Shouchella clausii]MBU3509381.1 aspartyl-phosphate phosphatase Spo0E family protein [Shouchella clausii]MDP0461980.1 aspartyl-phosphate phosphatase Spo0E family protein [Shouchella rhizosphaerae]MDP5267775.1 aspartyl-phosphate phosphatase Spo0E family protein [Shouchella clausii]